MSNLIGQQLGQYKIIALLGKGGMATVYRARQESISRDVAVKVIKPDLAGAEMFVARFEREARTVASFSHPHILKVFDYGQFEDTVYLVIELMTGGSLGDLIEQQKALSVEMTVKMLDQISQALDYAHRRGVIHRDLKPANVLLDDDQNAFLTDFGIAKVTSSGTGLTQSGIAMGTPSYMPPEQWRGETVDARADIYALGVMVFEMLTGRVPFQGDTPFSMMYKHLNDPPPALGMIRTDISGAVDAVIYRALAKNPDDRYESAAALSSAFKQALKSGADDPSDTFLFPAEQEAGSTEIGSGGTPPGLTRAGATSAGTPRRAGMTPTEALPIERRGLPVALIAVGVVVALLVIIGGVLAAAAAGSAANQNQTATAAQVVLAATTVSNNANGTATQLAVTSASAADSMTKTQAARLSTLSAASVTAVPLPILTIAAPNGNATSTPISIAVAATGLTGTVSSTGGAQISAATLAPTQSPSVTPSLTSTQTLTVTSSLTSTLTPTLTATLTPTLTSTLTSTLMPSLTLSPTITLTPSSTLTFTPAPPVLTGTGICEIKTSTVNFTIKDVGGPATGTYIVVDSSGFSQDGILSLLAGESTTLSFRKVYGIVTLIATVNGATQQFTFGAQCGPKPSATPLPPTLVPTSTRTPLPPTSTALPIIPPTVAPLPTGDNSGGGTPGPTAALTQVAIAPAAIKPALAYISRVNSRQGIYTINFDGTNQNALTNTTNTYSPPLTWSPDHSQIAFVLRTNTGESVWVINADGTNATRFAPSGPGTASYPAWSPDGQHIAYIGTVNGRSGVYVMNAGDGSEQHSVTNIALKTSFLAWGSDSQHIFFVSAGVWVATLDGNAATQINSDTRASSVVVSPNGYKLAVVSGTSIYILDVQHKYAQTPLVDNGIDPSWAPASARLTYSANGAIYTIGVDGANAKKIADLGTQPVWSPNGVHIAYVSGGALFVVGYEGGAAHQIAPNAQSPVWAP